MANNTNSAFLAARTRFTGTMNPGTVANLPSSDGGDASVLRTVLGDACACFKKAVNNSNTLRKELGSDAATVADAACRIKWAEVNVGDVVFGFERPLGGRVERSAELLGSNGLRGFIMTGYEEQRGNKWDIEVSVVNHVGIGELVDERGMQWSIGKVLELKGVSGSVMVGKDEGWLKEAAVLREMVDENVSEDGEVEEEIVFQGKRDRVESEDRSKRAKTDMLLKTEGRDFNGVVWSVNDGSGRESVAKVQLLLRCWSVERVTSVFNESIKWSMDIFMEAVKMESCKASRKRTSCSLGVVESVDGDADFARIAELSEYPIMQQRDVLEKFLLGEVSVISEKMIGLKTFCKSTGKSLPSWGSRCTMNGRRSIAECLSTWCHVTEVFLIGGMSKTCQFMVDELMSHRSCFEFVSDFVIGKEIWLVLATCMIDLRKNRKVGDPGGCLGTPKAIKEWFAFNLQGLIDTVEHRVPDLWQYEHYVSKLTPFGSMAGVSSMSSNPPADSGVVTKGSVGLCGFHLGGLLDLKSKNGDLLVCSFKPCKMTHFKSLSEYPEAELINFSKGQKSAGYIKEAVKAHLLKK